VAVGVNVLVGSSVAVDVGGTGVSVGGSGVAVGGTALEDPHALNKIQNEIVIARYAFLTFIISPFLMKRQPVQRFALTCAGQSPASVHYPCVCPGCGVGHFMEHKMPQRAKDDQCFASSKNRH
jgi:hypothetical protein